MSLKPSTPKPRPCAHCGKLYTPARPLQNVCSARCGTGLIRARKAQAKAEKKVNLRERKDRMAEAQEAFNRYIRLRDAGKSCICCGLPLGDGSIDGGYDAGHYRSVGSAPHLRFDERNVHAQRKLCNRYGAGRAADYRRGLIERIGLAEVEALEADQDPRKWTLDELREIKRTYSAKARAIEGARQASPERSASLPQRHTMMPTGSDGA